MDQNQNVKHVDQNEVQYGEKIINKEKKMLMLFIEIKKKYL